MNPRGKMRFELMVSEVAPSPNTYVRAHWTVYQKIKTLWSWLIVMALQGSGKPLVPLPKAKVSIARFASRLLDPDNLVAAQKPVIDALKSNGIIQDDTAEHIELHVEQSKPPKGSPPCTLILIEARSS